MTSPFTYDFGYEWPLLWFHAIPIALGLIGVAAGLWLHWQRWIVVVAAAFAVWGCVGLFFIHVVGGINAPMRLLSDQFLVSDRGRFLDVGAGSGRAAIGVLQARPHTTATAVDIYRGYFGIDGNTPERFTANARIAGVADRVDEVRVGDMRKLPFADAAFDAAVSTYAVDHIPRKDVPVALREIARVLKPGGAFMLGIVNPDAWVRVTMPIPHFGLAAHHGQDPKRWHAMLEEAGFEVREEGTRPATLYWLALKRS